MDNLTRDLTAAEWQEACELIGENWGAENGEDFAAIATATCFIDFTTSGPGYFGPVYVFLGDEIGHPGVLIRRDGKLVIAS